jgi:hypothetical protein
MHDLIKNDATGQRKFVPIKLDGTSCGKYEELKGYQADANLAKPRQDAGADGADKVSAIEWYGALKPVISALGVTGVNEVRFLVAAMTHAQAVELQQDPDRYAVEPAVFRLMCELMDRTAPFDPNRYGTSPNDWKPFPQRPEATIDSLLSGYVREKLEWAQKIKNPTKSILVSYSDEVLSADPKTRLAARNALKDDGGPFLVLIDPVSLMHRAVHDRLFAGGLHAHDQGFILGVAPFAAHMHADLCGPIDQIDERLEALALLEEPYGRFKQSYQPHARTSVLNVEHEHQFRRWLQVAADGIITANRTPLRLHAINPAVLKIMEADVKAAPAPEVIRMSAGGATS